MNSRVLICDDEPLIRMSVSEYLSGRGYQTCEAANGVECIEQVYKFNPDVILLDLSMPQLDGIGVLKQLEALSIQLPVLVITGFGAIDSAIEATRLGAKAYMQKPFNLKEMELQLAKHIPHPAGPNNHFGALVGDSPDMKKIYRTIERVTSVNVSTVLISGESGTGKNLVAQTLHEKGKRKEEPFVVVDCAALPEHLADSELFGVEKGGPNDTNQLKYGLVEIAAEGTVFLDEITALPLPVQAKFLRALEHRKFRRVGGVTDIPLKAAVIASSTKDLQTAINQKEFREDLFLGLNVIPIQTPPLRSRPTDMPLLISHFIDQFNAQFDRRVEGVTNEVLELFQKYNWPGNVRELRNVIERIMILSGDVDLIGFKQIPFELAHAQQIPSFTPGSMPPIRQGDDTINLPQSGVVFDQLERNLIVQALTRVNGNQSAAAKLLGLTRYAFRYRMEKNGLLTKPD